MPRFVVDADRPLLDFLRDRLPGWKATTIRQRLKNDLVVRNGTPLRSGAVVVRAGEVVEVLSVPAGPASRLPVGLGRPPLDVLYADDDLLAVDKPTGLLSVASERERNQTAVHLMREWLSGLDRDRNRELHAAHRLDREASGVLLLARSLDVKRRLAESWHRFEKTYLAVVDGVPPESEGTVGESLWEDRGLFVRVASEKGGGESALTHYRVVKRSGSRCLLEVRLGTGRKHQIRVHLAHIGCPIVGDLRYGLAKASRLALHAKRLVILHPRDGRRLAIEADTPREFSKLLRQGIG